MIFRSHGNPISFLNIYNCTHPIFYFLLYFQFKICMYLLCRKWRIEHLPEKYLCPHKSILTSFQNQSGGVFWITFSNFSVINLQRYTNTVLLSICKTFTEMATTRLNLEVYNIHANNHLIPHSKRNETG